MSGPQFKNGRAPDSELVEIAAGVPVWRGTANAWARMKAAAAEDGIDLWPAGTASGYRSLFVQQDMHDHPGLYDLNPASSISLAAAGYSTHGWGTRVDIGSAWNARLDWLLSNAGRFGFSREFGADDPNHFAHDGFTAIEAPDDITAAAAASTPIPVEELTSMPEIYISTPNHVVSHIMPQVKDQFDNAGDYETWKQKVDFLRGAKATDLISPPALANVVGVDWDTYKRICRIMQVPEA